MKQFFIKYLLWFFSFLTVVLIYLLQTSLGHHSLAQLFSLHLSKKTDNHIVVSSLKIDAYPFVEMDITINNSSTVHIKGELNYSSMEMDYHLVGDSFQYNKLSLESKIDIHGHLSGLRSNLLVEGKGEIMEGTTAFTFIRTPSSFNDFNISLNSVESKKVLKFLHHEPLVSGRADINATFKTFSKYKKEGKSLVLMKHARVETLSGGIPFKLKQVIEFKGTEYFYQAGMKSDVGKFTILDGYFNQKSAEFKGIYFIHIDELLFFEPLLKRKYRGSFESNGEFSYKNGFDIVGKSSKFDGLINYRYRHKHLKLGFKGLSLVKLSQFFSYPTMLSANLYGFIDYDTTDKLLLINSKLKNTQFKKTKITDMILKRIEIDMLQDVYDDSSFIGRYQESILNSTLKIDNGVRHIYLTKTKINVKTNSITSRFELKIGGENLSGDIYGTVNNPQVSLDMKRLLKNQINKGFRSLFGIKGEKAVKKKINRIKEDVSNTLEEVNVDSVKEKAKSFLNGFF
jgi:hypothetical protein